LPEGDERDVSERTALAFEDQEYTLAQLDALASGMATALEHRGVRAGERVALMSSNRPEFVIALRAIWQLGASAVLLSPAWKRTEVENALALTTPSHAVGDPQSVAEAVTGRTGVSWVTAYGTSELPVIACNEIEGARLDTVGWPVPGVRVRIVSLEDGDLLSPGAVGEIQVRSDSVMAGYLPSEVTAQAFSDGWYRTGDVGYLDVDGWLRITDRAKEMIKVRGFQVAPAEIEAVLHGHPAVEDCAVFGIPDSANGEAVVAAVKTRGPVEADELIALVGDRLASYKRPNRVVFVDEIPRLPSGKVLRRVLKERLWTSV
jgi:acyl-CoA synthetase (AMP-forming)/AMP-acid ligase II